MDPMSEGATIEHELLLGWARLLVGDLSGARDSLARVSQAVHMGADSGLEVAPQSLIHSGEVGHPRLLELAARFAEARRRGLPPR